MKLELENTYLILFPLDGVGSDISSFQLRPVFSGIPKRVPLNDAMLCFVDFGDKNWDSFKIFFKLRALSFRFCPRDKNGLVLRLEAPKYGS